MWIEVGGDQGEDIEEQVRHTRLGTPTLKSWPEGAHQDAGRAPGGRHPTGINVSPEPHVDLISESTLQVRFAPWDWRAGLMGEGVAVNWGFTPVPTFPDLWHPGKRDPLAE